MQDRKSEAELPPLITDPTELAEKEAENALHQFDWAMEEIDRWLAEDKPTLKLSTLLSLHRKAMSGIDRYAGNFRPAAVAIKGSKHNPIAGDDVARYVENMLEYVKDNWESKTALHLSSYVMWRLNWIHPFADGNGRTSRILSYMVLCAKLRQILPGTLTIPEQISKDKVPYYKALEAADRHYKKGTVNVSEMEQLLECYLANQLVNVQELASGRDLTSTDLEIEREQSLKAKFVAALEGHPVIAGGAFILIATIISLIFAA